jgi:D-ribose pyranase
MKIGGLLNPDLAHAIASVGHSQSIAVVDAGYPISGHPKRADLAVSPNLPRLLDVVRAILTELTVESYVVAAEIEHHNPLIRDGLRSLIDAPHHQIPHAEFKRSAAGAQVVVRTGEWTPFGNVILVSGVAFS